MRNDVIIKKAKIPLYEALRFMFVSYLKAGFGLSLK